MPPQTNIALSMYSGPLVMVNLEKNSHGYKTFALCSEVQASRWNIYTSPRNTGALRVFGTPVVGVHSRTGYCWDRHYIILHRCIPTKGGCFTFEAREVVWEELVNNQWGSIRCDENSSSWRIRQLCLMFLDYREFCGHWWNVYLQRSTFFT